MIPFYVYYSMFGFQRIGDLAWAAGDSRARGFLMGGTAGRTTLNGEGLQHEDGHSHLISATIPNCVSYDPTYAHEVAVIIQDGLRRMFTEQEDVFYYLTIMNENYEHPGMPEDRRGRGRSRASSAACTCCATVRRRRRAQGAPAGAAAGLRHHPARGRGGRRAARAGLRRGRGRLERARASPSCAATASTPTAGTCCTRARSRGSSFVEQSAGRAPGRSGRRRDRLHARVRRADPALGAATAATGCWAPTGSAARTTAQRCAGTSRSTATTSSLAALAELAAEGAVAGHGRRGRHRPLRHRPRQARPALA